MKKLLLLLPFLSSILLLTNCEEAQVLKFDPNDTVFVGDVSNFTGLIMPNNVSQEEMNQSIKSYYQYWKQNYVKESGSTAGGYYIYSGGGTGQSDDSLPTISVSEAHGFGMVIVALMGKDDPVESKKIFDGLYKFYKDHPCHDNPLLMAWEIKGDLKGGELSSDQSTTYSTGSATDGDIDIAYGLLLAHSLWGSDGDINYLQAADTLINFGIRGLEVGETTKRTTLGSWSHPTDYHTRPSDWMTGEFHSFAELTGESFWDDVVDTTYSIAKHIMDNYSIGTGLMPDFVVGKTPRPASPNFLEFTWDGEYYFNACRVPMRVMLDVAHFEDPFAVEWMMKVANWITKSTENNPSNIKHGYKIENGEPIYEWFSPTFASPLILVATIDSKYQNYVNLGWTKMKNWKYDYYEDCINFMCMLQITGNWWKPTL